MSSEIEKILCAAIWYRDLKLKKIFDCNVLPINCDRGIVFCGFRHPQCMYSMSSMTGLRCCEVKEYKQGFLTNKNRFVNRKDALEIAKNAGQIKDGIDPNKLTRLHSEDLY